MAAIPVAPLATLIRLPAVLVTVEIGVMKPPPAGDVVVSACAVPVLGAADEACGVTATVAAGWGV